MIAHKPQQDRTETGTTPVMVRLWPDAGQALGLTRNQTYDCANRGEIPTVTFGKLKRVPIGWLRRQGGLAD
jgi:hypothetical protein